VYGNEDYNNGFLGAVGVLMALENRTHTGKGDYLECPQVHSSLFTTSEHFLDADRKTVYGLRMDPHQMGFSALDRLYQTPGDGWICIACSSDANFKALCNGIGQPQLANDPRFKSPRARTQNNTELAAILEPFFAALSKEEAFAKLDAAGAAIEIAADDHWLPDFLKNSTWGEQTGRVVEHLQSMHGHIREVGIVTRLSATPALRKGPAPRFGEHTREILRELDYSSDQIETLIAGKKVLSN
jgi:crotonobetainyl-CoA:carnitine CoA-transferase CaiB-like acyl-CoA transferase